MNYGKAALRLGFIGLYFLPVLLESNALSISDSRVRLLFEQAFDSTTVWWGILLFVLSNILLCITVLLCLSWLAKQLSRASGIAEHLSLACCLLFGWATMVSVNAWLFPLSNYSVAISLLDSAMLGKILACIFVIFALVMVVVGAREQVISKVRPVFAIVLCSLFAVGLVSLSASSSATSTSTRNIIVIGVDSLSAHVLELHLDLLPNIAKTVAHAQYYTRAYTPLGRTFPAWVSLLSGKPPVDNGAFFNLRNMEHVSRDGLLPNDLRQAGYRTVFAIDERRFANIDESFGFDEVVGPRLGVLDFVLQAASDTPLTNILLQTKLGRFILPYSYINSASYANYSADEFVSSVISAARVDKSLFLAVHFESAHFPFKTRHARQQVKTPNAFLSQHLQALTAVDWQIGQLLVGLGRKGLLDNTLLMVLSDHGEGLGEVEATLSRDGKSVPLRGYGHGADIVSDHQNRIVLAATSFLGGKPQEGAAMHVDQVSLLDVRRAINGYVRTGTFQIEPMDPCLIVETGIRLDATNDYRSLSEAKVAQQAASYYEVDSEGRLRLREDRLSELLKTKDIGLRCPNQLTWYEAATKRYLAYDLDSQGAPIEQRSPERDAVERIMKYKNKYAR
ncbi:sulfatase-like hydrolase/transferase [Pseudomonas citronellolis]|uniref:sulfatase-like hydrolase/transferase n=1 Tax=Pseudomonas citronellolis TaxID=53408 RepID=UPI0021C12BE3|nr:sulfatase-like hydrolase/transferase [Pseudomonas citronellolis]MDN6871353.1 sulfatase-like hydrolase/transferase [Pseudomonas citronellolis]UXJ51774.1 sulfatase-like hydrolase/transferase [Pseudomonas citronellolis]